VAVRRRPAELADHTIEHVMGREAARIAVVVPPWLGWFATLGLGFLLHHMWPNVISAILAGCCGLVVAGVLSVMTHHRKGLTRWIGAATTVLAAAWLGWAEASGIGLHSPVFQTWLMAGGTVALVWAAHLHIHDGGDEAGLAAFQRWTTQAGYPGLRLIRDRAAKAGKLGGELIHRGLTHDEAQKAISYVETHAGVPKGTFVLTTHDDDAGKSRVAIADPRTLNNPIPVPWAATRPAEPRSIAGRQDWGRFKDGEPIDPVVTDSHAQVMATTGAGKTFSCLYNEGGWTMTCADAFMIVLDLAKGLQFIGPMEKGLHLAVTGPELARVALERVKASCKPRMEHLRQRKLGNWEPGCGLMHGTLWIEEAAETFEALGDGGIEDQLFPLLRFARSGGWRVVYSLHRASYDQMPTFLRSMVGFICLGVTDDRDAQFGLSTEQQNAELDPSVWANYPEHKGKAYLGLPSLSTAHRIMAGRYYNWGQANAAPALMERHAAMFPAEDRPLDAVTLPYFADLMRPSLVPFPVAGPVAPVPAAVPAQNGDEEMQFAFDEPADPPDLHDPDPEGLGADLDDAPLTAEEIEAGDVPIPGMPQDSGPPDVEPVSREVAIEMLRRLVADWRAKGGVPQRHGPPQMKITIPDLREYRDSIGKSRPWLYDALEVLMDEGEIRRDPAGGAWLISRKAA